MFFFLGFKRNVSTGFINSDRKFYLENSDKNILSGKPI